MNQLLSKRDMTVKSLIGAQGEVFRLDSPVSVSAGQRLYYGVYLDGTPLVRVASDTPIFDEIADNQLRPATDVIGIAASQQITHVQEPTVSWWVPSSDIAVAPRPAPSRLGLRLEESELDDRAHHFEVTAEFAGQGADAPVALAFQSAPDYSTYIYPPAATAEQLLIPLPRRD
jgi:hypothetical protein